MLLVLAIERELERAFVAESAVHNSFHRRMRQQSLQCGRAELEGVLRSKANLAAPAGFAGWG